MQVEINRLLNTFLSKGVYWSLMMAAQPLKFVFLAGFGKRL